MGILRERVLVRKKRGDWRDEERWEGRERMTCGVRKGQELVRKTEKEKENKKRKKRKKKWGADETERGRNNKREE